MPEKTPSTQTTKLHYGIYACYAFLSLISLCASYSLTGKILTSLVNVLVGLGIMILFSKISYKFLNKFSTIALLLAFVLLVITLIFGSGGGGRSLSIGGAKIQTLYIVTIIVVFYMSAFLARLPRKFARIDKEAKIRNLSNKECEFQKEQVGNQLYFTAMIVLAIFIAMIAMRNISTAILLSITGLSILFVTNIRFKYILFFVLVMGICGGIYLTYDTLHDRAKQDTEVADKEVKTRGATGFNRIKFFFTGESDVEGYGRQMVMAKTAIARSLTRPAGPGKGMMKGKMSEGENDFVFAMICEEFTIVAGIFIILLYIILFNISLKISRRIKPGTFACYFTVGIGVLIVGQALIHIAVNVGMIPATGQTLPFISRGLTNLIVTSAAIGILINIAKQNDWDEDEEVEENA